MMSKKLAMVMIVGTIIAGGLVRSDEVLQQAPHVLSDLRTIQIGGCGVAGKRTGDFHLTTIDGRLARRDYEVIVPTMYDPSRSWAVTFVYHGAGQNQAAAKSYGLQHAPGAAESSIFVFPQGVNYLSSGIGWDDSSTGYDTTLFDNMLASLEADYCIDSKRVFVAGFSWGCDQVTALTCSRGDRIRAVGAASCTDEFTDRTDYRSYQSCPVRSTAAIRFTHDASGGDSGYPSPLFATTSALYRSFNSCSSSAAPLSPGPCSSYLGCASPLIECSYPGLGHTLPSGWAGDTWTFFSSFR
jgi:polyhydroxybutyrate depolymerase